MVLDLKRVVPCGSNMIPNKQFNWETKRLLKKKECLFFFFTFSHLIHLFTSRLIFDSHFFIHNYFYSCISQFTKTGWVCRKL